MQLSLFALVDDVTKKLVDGYLREQQENIQWPANVPFYNIPVLVNQMIAIFSYIVDEWDLAVLNSHAIENKYRLKGNVLTANVTKYGPMALTKHVSSGTHHWRFKVTYYDQAGCTYQCGIWKTVNSISSDPHCKSWLGNYADTAYVLRFNRSVLNIHDQRNGKAEHGRMTVKTGDIFEMYLSLAGVHSRLQFVVNGKKCGGAVQVDPATYCAVVQLYKKDDAIEFVSYDFASFVDREPVKLEDLPPLFS